MSIFFNDKRTWYKVVQRCKDNTDNSCFIACSLNGDDLITKVLKDKDEDVIEKLFPHYCSRCVITMEILSSKEVKTAKKFYTIREV